MRDDTDISKSQRKRDMHALQDLGTELVELREDQLRNLQLPDSLHDAIRDARSITQRGARRRQLQYVGRLMRDVDADQLRQQLDLLLAGGKQETAILHQAERWREKLLADDSAAADFVSDHPQCDVQKLRTLMRNSRREAAAGKPPRSYRELLRLIRHVLVEEQTTSRQNVEPGHGTGTASG